MKDRWFFTPTEIGPFVQLDPQYIRIMAKLAPEKLPFETEIRYCLNKETRTLNSKKHYTRIPKQPFLDWYTAQGCDPTPLLNLGRVEESEQDEAS